MRGCLFQLAVILLLCSNAAAWGPQAQRLFCENAVDHVWGVQALSCLDNAGDLCDQLGRINGPQMRQDCLQIYSNGIDVAAYNVPEVVFQDFENHYNYESCPLRKVKGNDWICVAGENLAGIEAQSWFDLAAVQSNTCDQVRAFCIGSYYFAKSEFVLNQLQNFKGCIGGDLESLIDENLLSKRADWEAKRQCVFSYMKPMAGRSLLTTNHITFIVTDSDVTDLMGEIALEAEYVRNPTPIALKTTTIRQTTSTTTTMPTTSVTSTSIPTTSTSLQTTTLPTTTHIRTTSSTTSTARPTTSTRQATTSTLMAPTSTFPPSTTISVGDKNESFEDIDRLFEDMDGKIVEKQDDFGFPIEVVVIGFTALLFLVCVVLGVWVYSSMRRPKAHVRQKVIVPPSVRRRLKMK